MNLLKIKKNTIILLIITLIVLYIVLKDDFYDICKTFEKIDMKYIILALIFYFLSIIIRGYVNYLIINDKEKVNLKEAIKHNLITQFFNGITPFSTGGQPMEIYLLTEHNIDVAQGTNKTIQSFIFYQVALVICGFLAVTYNFIFHIFPKINFLAHLILLGFIINIAVTICLMLISFSKKTTIILSKIYIKIIKHIKKNVDEDNIKRKFEEYYNGFQELKNRKKIIIIGIVLNIISLLCLYIVPIFILYSMGDYKSLNVADTLTTSAYVYVIGSFVPIPGASGGIEYGFTQFYGNFIKINIISAMLLIWRFITYYLGVIIGALLFYIEKGRKHENRNIH